MSAAPVPPRFLISGYYGFENLGDEAILSALTHQLRARRPDAVITALSASPERTRARLRHAAAQSRHGHEASGNDGEQVSLWPARSCHRCSLPSSAIRWAGGRRPTGAAAYQQLRFGSSSSASVTR